MHLWAPVPPPAGLDVESIRIEFLNSDALNIDRTSGSEAPTPENATFLRLFLQNKFLHF